MNICDVLPTKYSHGHTMDRVPGANHVCCLCPAGKFIEKPCTERIKNDTVCSPCKFMKGDIDQQFFIQHGPHNKSFCLKSKAKCKQAEYRIEGNRTADAQCKERTKCKPGFGVTQPTSTSSDTVCGKCKEGYEAPTFSATEMCTNNQIATTIESALSASTSTVLSTTTLQTTSTHANSRELFSGVEIAVITVFCVLIVVVPVLILKKGGRD
uniref:Tumor necrosis factor receptor superfamily member 21-like n=1 Tax=Phallusia mammillata TaxID=59560 RepID=A0A6F9DVV9_9ASCI|nr:tumor necrosis factor receptor superfamily member 21-like [Phallusia mammillata]